MPRFIPLMLIVQKDAAYQESKVLCDKDAPVLAVPLTATKCWYWRFLLLQRVHCKNGLPITSEMWNLYWFEKSDERGYLKYNAALNPKQ